MYHEDCAKIRGDDGCCGCGAGSTSSESVSGRICSANGVDGSTFRHCFRLHLYLNLKKSTRESVRFAPYGPVDRKGSCSSRDDINIGLCVCVCVCIVDWHKVCVVSVQLSSFGLPSLNAHAMNVLSGTAQFNVENVVVLPHTDSEGLIRISWRCLLCADSCPAASSIASGPNNN